MPSGARTAWSASSTRAGRGQRVLAARRSAARAELLGIVGQSLAVDPSSSATSIASPRAGPSSAGSARWRSASTAARVTATPAASAAAPSSAEPRAASTARVSSAAVMTPPSVLAASRRSRRAAPVSDGFRLQRSRAFARIWPTRARVRSGPRPTSVWLGQTPGWPGHASSRPSSIRSTAARSSRCGRRGRHELVGQQVDARHAGLGARRRPRASGATSTSR